LGGGIHITKDDEGEFPALWPNMVLHQICKISALKVKKGGQKRETALAADSPLPWLMFAQEQGAINGAQRIINCPCQVLWPQGHKAMVHWKTTGVQQNKAVGAGATRVPCP